MTHIQAFPNNINHFDVAILGAGLSGSLCAQQLKRMGLKVCVIEKSRGSGGRAGSKRLEGDLSCDLGAPSVQATNPRTKSLMADLVSKGIVAYWLEADTDQVKSEAIHCVGIPKMSAITRHWLKDITLITNTRVHHIERHTGDDKHLIWHLRDEDYNPIVSANKVLLTTPAPQAAMVLASTSNVEDLLLLASKAGQSYQPQWAMWIETDPSDLPAILHTYNSPLLRLVKDSQKPNRVPSQAERWVIHSTHEWAQQNVNSEKQAVSKRLTDAFSEQTKLKPIRTGEPHRWLLSRSLPIETAKSFVWDKGVGIGLAGDWLCQGNAEGAILSALRLCDFIKNEFDHDSTFGEDYDNC